MRPAVLNSTSDSQKAHKSFLACTSEHNSLWSNRKMWALDRLSSHNASQPSLPPSRSFSPAPRRSNLGPARPPYNPRDSHLSLVSANSSHHSLPANARIPNVKRQTAVAPPPEVEDPLAALERIVGKKLDSAPAPDLNEEPLRKPETLLADISFEGLSLQEFADRKSIANSSVSNVPDLSTRSIEECMLVSIVSPSQILSTC